ncbi:hypothetical protein [Arthrobacter sp. HMWF013]|uniref:hypothetical protein n=1 Tax=Arthrobacter sp. HMWF013 TaxID=2056849 RepID=UPI000D3C9080|nr:hypothetical protein [Arthrobacter sp. HMWF013]PTT68654.1 hypothetical protein DBR22_05965 [Arthrobacter sp. HMWF013]
MRVAKSDVIAGLPAELARAIVRRFRGREMAAEAVADLLEGTGAEPRVVLAQLEAAGYLEKVQVDHRGDTWWDTTVQGNALAMASFGKPISRKTANRLVSELLERARAYNADPVKPLFLNSLRVFGSYLNPEIDPLGDVDIELTYGRRITDPKVVSAYARASGRSFNTYVDQLMWPQTELVQHLRKRSAFINITLEDITQLTDRSETIYSIDADPQAAPPPVDRSLVGR